MTITVIPVTGIPEIETGTDLAALLLAHATPETGDVVVVSQKAVSKAEGRIVSLDEQAHNDIVREESKRVLRTRGGTVVSETKHGFICANAGVDLSNVAPGTAALLPVDPDSSARRLRNMLRAQGHEVAVLVTDTFGRPWRRGLTDVAIGVAGLGALLDLRGEVDSFDRPLLTTEIAVADEIAAAADLVMGKAKGIPMALVRGIDGEWFRESSSRELVRPPGEDWFR